MNGPNPSPSANLCQEISHLLYAKVISAHSQQATLLSEPCRNWLRVESPEQHISRIMTRLARQPDTPALLRAVETLLNKLFVSAFQTLPDHAKVLGRVQELIAAQAPQIIEPVAVATLEGGPIVPPPAALLLLDAENLNPPEALEKFLQSIGQYPIRHRLAFGHWSKLGNRDYELYQRGYQMIHVPSGKNSADVKMSLDAAWISLWNPAVREVFICSTDADFKHLSYTLLNQGITPYQVSRHKDHFAILNIATQSREVFHLPQADSEAKSDVDPLDIAPSSSAEPTSKTASSPSGKSPSLKQMAGWLKILILQAQEANPDQPVTIGTLGKLFCDRNQISANQALQANSDYETLKQFLSAHPAFDLHPLPDSQHLQVKLNAEATGQATKSQEDAQALKQQSQKQQGTKPPTIKTALALEQALVKLLLNLCTNQAGSQVALSSLGSEFTRVHKESMSKVLKRLGEPKGLPKFLTKCGSLQTRKQGTIWWVTLARES